MTAKLPLPQLDASHLGAHRLFALTDDALFDACGVRIAFTSRSGGVSSGSYASLNCGNHVGDDAEAVMQNRSIVLDALGEGASLKLIVPSQVHGTEIVEMGPDNDVLAVATLAAEGADGILVRTSRVAALLNFADCLPLIIVAPSGDFVVAHAGWRGAVAHIAAKAADLLAIQGEDPAGFNAYIGPFIHAECFEVSTEIAQQFAAEFESQVLLDSRHVDLFEAVSMDLIRSGLSSERIIEAGVCTRCHPDEFFSYRATDGICGRHSAVAAKLRP